MSDASRSKTWTVRSVLAWSKQFFSDQNIESPSLESQVLLAHALDLDRIELFIQHDRPLYPEELQRYKALIIRRARERCPLAYIINKREFWSLPLAVSPDVLIPRPETECVVEAAIKFLRAQKTKCPVVLDVCTGSGAIALAIASEFAANEIEVWASDISQKALELARKNASSLNLDTVQFLHADLLEGIELKADLIVSNPPYITWEELKLLAPELKHEPQIALDGGEDGLEIHRRLIMQANSCLRESGALILEIGATQAEAVQAICKEAGFASSSVGKDFSGLDRYIVALRKL
ncbi:MAG: peptide chain release factor N(5)-glutamine methyltransferase [Bradymonadales bacterium]|jgi:release factor glutamine methyltransferase